MILVQGGTFQMGSNNGESNEKPIHPVTLSDFLIGKYEVTQKQWRDVTGKDPSYFKNCDNCPVEQVSWNDIQEFIQKINQKTGKIYRLPTEAEWEYAAGGGNAVETLHATSLPRTHFAGTDNESELTEYAWFEKNSNDKTHPVGQKKPNQLGLHDMSGNVWEWCSDWYGSDYYPGSPASNPKGPPSGSSRVVRGGSWGSFASYCRVASRGSNPPGNRNSSIGFRLVLVP